MFSLEVIQALNAADDPDTYVIEVRERAARRKAEHAVAESEDALAEAIALWLEDERES